MPRQRRWGSTARRVGVAGWLAALLVTAPDALAEPDAPRFERVERAFEGAPGHWSRALDAVSADADADGDADLLLSWHHLAELELFENREGRFRRVSPDDLGLVDVPGVVSLFGAADLGAQLRGEARTGLFLWHDQDRRGAWNVLWLDPGEQYPDATAHLETSLAFVEIEGTPVRAADPRRLSLPLDGPERSVRARTQRIASELRVRIAGAQAPIFVGDPPQRMPGGTVSLWLPDPHGMTWIDFSGDPRPDLFIARGALGGRLRPPLPAKRDRAFEARSGPGLGFSPSATTVPPDHGAGRRSEWLWLGKTGLALLVSRRGDSPRLLVADGHGALRDAATAHGLDDDVDAFTLGDLDGDGLDDLIGLSGASLTVRHHDGVRFGSPRPLARFPAPDPADDPLQVPSLRLADFDADGALDIFALGLGARGTSRLLLRRGDDFADVTEEAGIADLDRQKVFALGDWDGDGFIDVVSFGREGGVLWHNQHGTRFALSALPPALVPERITAAVTLDVDGDRRSDLVLAGRRRHLLRNATGSSPRPIAVELVADRTPIGALLRCVDADGRGAVHRVGSTQGSALSQGVLPILCGGAGAEPMHLLVRWPGSDAPQRHPAPAAGGRTRIAR